MRGWEGEGREVVKVQRSQKIYVSREGVRERVV